VAKAGNGLKPKLIAVWIHIHVVGSSCPCI